MKNKASLSQNTKGGLFIISALLIFGSYSLFLRFLPNISTLSFLFFFQLFGAVVFFILFLKKGLRKINKGEFIFFVTLALVALGNDLAYFSAIRLTTVANATLAHQMATFFILFLAPLILKEKTQKYEMRAVFISLLGLLVLYGKSLNLNNLAHFFGLSLGFLSALFYALVIIHFRLLTKKGLTIYQINFFRYSISLIIITPFLFKFGNLDIQLSNLVPLTLFGLLFAVIATILHTVGISLTKSIRAAVIGQSEPVIATFYALLFLKEVPSVETILGGALIIGSSLWLTLKRSS